MPNLTPPSPLLHPIVWQGQEYATSQYFHQQYLATSPYSGKYQRHPDVLRVVRRMPAYDKYLSHGDIIELAWPRIKAEAKQVLLYFQRLFQAAGYRPLPLLNATAQAELVHHLDDERKDPRPCLT